LGTVLAFRTCSVLDIELLHSICKLSLRRLFVLNGSREVETMLKSITCVILLIPIVILLHVVLLVGESIVLTAGTSGGPGQLPKFSGLNIVLVI